MKNLQRLLAALIVTGLAGLASLGTAQARTGNALFSACRADHKSFCASVKPGGGGVADCLKQHEAELQPACKAQLGTLSACSQQVRQLCASAGQAGLRDCMKSHAAQLRPVCGSGG
ncbi:MAG: cysteine rich repeat-containing protein [Ramlibacter sp.]